MVIAVTGAAGFIGSTLVDRLVADGHTVAGLDYLTPFYGVDRKLANLEGAVASSRFELTLGDVRSATTVERWLDDVEPEVVVHLAAQPGIGASLSDPVATEAVNVGGTATLVDALVGRGGVRLVLVSSSSVYGPGEVQQEAQPLAAPAHPYAASKQAAEALAQAAHTAHGLDVCVVRPFSVVGPRQRPDLVLHRFLAAASRGAPVTLTGDGSQSRDFTDVEDVVDVLAGAARRSWGYEVLNAGAGRSVSLHALLDLVEAVLERPVERQRVAAREGDVARTCADRGRLDAVLPGLTVTPLLLSVQRQAAWMGLTRG